MGVMQRSCRHNKDKKDLQYNFLNQEKWKESFLIVDIFFIKEKYNNTVTPNCKHIWVYRYSRHIVEEWKCLSTDFTNCAGTIDITLFLF
jgi:hypothetical protein